MNFLKASSFNLGADIYEGAYTAYKGQWATANCRQIAQVEIRINKIKVY